MKSCVSDAEGNYNVFRRCGFFNEVETFSEDRHKCNVKGMELHVLECLEALRFIRSQTNDRVTHDSDGKGDEPFVEKAMAKLKCFNNDTSSEKDVVVASKKKNQKEAAKANKKKDFDMSRYRQRHIALQIQYEGGPYFGFTSQTGGSEETIEKHLFAALTKLKLIEDRYTCSYSRCGRTDRGVSALGQIIALKVRSAIPLSVDDSLVPKHPCDAVLSLSSLPDTDTDIVVDPAAKLARKSEKDTDGTGAGGSESSSSSSSATAAAANQHNNSIGSSNAAVLPQAETAEAGEEAEAAGEGEQGTHKQHQPSQGKKRKAPTSNSNSDSNVTAVSAAPPVKEMDYCGLLNRVLPEDIRAVGWCEVTPEFSSRFSAAYRTYRYFFVRKNLNIDAMNEAAALLIGDHDFRNLCKMDIVKVSNFRREVYSAEVLPFMENKEHPEQTVMMLQIRGIAFLWHMVRCIMAVLTMVGEGVESPDIVTRLFDVDTNPAKPSYMMANELPLVLHECGFDNMTILHQPQVMWGLMSHYEVLWERHTVAACRAYNAMQTLKERVLRHSDAVDFISFIIDKRRVLFDRKVSGAKKGVKVVSTCTAAATAATAAAGVREDDDEASEVEKKAKKLLLSIVTKDGGSTGTATTADVAAVAAAEVVRWGDVLQVLKQGFDLTPSAPAQPHVPLLQRNLGDTYEERVNQLKGKNKERLDRHLQLQETASERDPDFFTRMRIQGSLL